jgi:hypothetical protein
MACSGWAGLGPSMRGRRLRSEGRGLCLKQCPRASGIRPSQHRPYCERQVFRLRRSSGNLGQDFRCGRACPKGQGSETCRNRQVLRLLRNLQVLAGANADDSFSDDNDSGVGLRVCTRRVDFGGVSYDDCTIRHLRPCGSTDQQEHEQKGFPRRSSRWLDRSLTRWVAARFPPRLSCDSPPIISAATISRGVPMPDPPAPLRQR